MNDRRVLVDCRWLGYSGVGRVTEMLLTGLKELEPDGKWVLWGPPEAEPFRWPGSSINETTTPPLTWAAQRAFFSVPHADVILWPHAVRPLVRRRSVVMVHDVIPVHWASGSRSRLAWRSFFRRSCLTATEVAVHSEATGEALTKFLGVLEWTKVSYPIDSARAERIRSLRTTSETGSGERQPRMLYVGQVKPHKNLVRAVEGFLASDFYKHGGKFSILAGGAVDPEEMERVRFAAGLGVGSERRTEGQQVEILARCSDAELDELYASATFLILPSLEEGYGLPVTEALAAGIPVCCSDIGGLTEAAHGLAELFNPESVASIAGGIDSTWHKAEAGYSPHLGDMPTCADFAAHILELIEKAFAA
ncbi:MAG: glycosyltransferase family 1 protein [Acidimicrobiales bacterium]